MFIKILYKHSKAGCIGFVAFILAFLFINYKWGVVATPILQFGMFSSKSFFKDTQTLYWIEANNKIIDCAKISQEERDVLQYYPEYYEKQEKLNHAAYSVFKKFVNIASTNSLIAKVKFTNNLNDSIFSVWYKGKVEKIINEPVINLAIFKQHFTIIENKMTSIDNPQKVSYIVP